MAGLALLFTIAFSDTAAVDDARLAKWFDKLGYAREFAKPFGKITVSEKGMWSTRGEIEHQEYGFLVRTNDHGFETLSVSLRPDSFSNSGQSSGQLSCILGSPTTPHTCGSKATFEKVDFRSYAKLLLERARSSSDKGGLGEAEGQPPASRSALFVFSRICATRGASDLAKSFLALAKSPRFKRVGIDDQGHESWQAFRDEVRDDLAGQAYEQVAISLVQPSVVRRQSLRQVSEFRRDYGGTYRALGSKSVEMVLRKMASEDEAHAKALQVPFEQMDTAQKVKELIFRLREEEPNTRGVTLNGSTVFRPAWTGLVQLGFDAVPALINALPDRSFTKSFFLRMGVPGRFGVEDIYRVGDLAKQILEVIAERRFETEHYNRPEEARAEIEKWWASVRPQNKNSPPTKGRRGV